MLSLAACILFAYGVAWLLAASHRKGILPGAVTSLVLGGALAAANWIGLAWLPHDLLVIEAGYATLATLIIGAIVGGLWDKVVVPSH